MTEADEFIQDFLEHRFYDPRKAHEYYMRTRKLVGKGPSKIQRIDLNPFNNDSKKSTSRTKSRSKLDFNDDVRLDTSQVRDMRDMDDPTRGDAKKPEHVKKVAEEKKKLDRLGTMLDRVRAAQKKTPLHDLPKKYKLAKLELKLVKEYRKQLDLLYPTARDYSESKKKIS